mgnify:CR=1 FL=1
MELETVLYRVEGNVGIVSLNRTKALNAMSKQIFVDLTTAFDAAEKDDTVRCVVVNAEGRAFCAGGDIPEMKGLDNPEAVFDFYNVAGIFMKKMINFVKPTITVAHGAIAGAGTSLLLAGDIALVSDDAMFMVAFGFSIGAQILIARRNGEQQYKEIGNLFYQGIYFQLGMAAVMFVVCYSFAPVILKRLVSSEHIYDAAMSYLNWRVFGFFFSFTAVMFRAFFLGTTQTKTLTLNSIVMVLSNVVFNYILIFGKFGFPVLGIAGAAIGSSLAELVSLVFFIIYTRNRIDIRKYGLDKIPGIRWNILKRMLNVSFWTMVQNFLSLSTWFLLFLYVEHLGERSLAITNIIRNVSGIMFMVMMAFASTCGSLVSNLIGAGNISCVPGTIRQHIRIAYAFVLPFAVFFALFPKLILGVYTDMPELQEAAIPSLWVLCSAYLFLVPANVYFQSVSGTGNTRTALALELITLVIYTCYITYIVAYLKLDVAFAWTSEIVYSVGILVLCYFYMKKGKWSLKKI